MSKESKKAVSKQVPCREDSSIIIRYSVKKQKIPALLLKQEWDLIKLCIISKETCYK
jgi:hypothetical protein